MLELIFNESAGFYRNSPENCFWNTADSKCARKDDMSNYVLEYKYLPDIDCTGRTRHLASYNQEMLSNLRTPPSPSSIIRQEQFFYRIPPSGCFRLMKGERGIRKNSV